MNKLLALGALGVTFAVLRWAIRRVATHQRVFPSVTGRVNTRVIRINQR